MLDDMNLEQVSKKQTLQLLSLEAAFKNTEILLHFSFPTSRALLWLASSFYILQAVPIHQLTLYIVSRVEYFYHSLNFHRFHGNKIYQIFQQMQNYPLSMDVFEWRLNYPVRGDGNCSSIQLKNTSLWKSILKHTWRREKP